MRILKIFLLDDLVGLARLFPALLCLGLLGMLAAEFIRSAAPADEKAVFVSVPLAVSYVLFRAASVAGRNPRLRSANPVNWDDRVEVSLAISVFFLLVLLVLAALSMLVYKLLLLTWAVDIAFRSIMILVAMLIADCRISWRRVSSSAHGPSIVCS